MTTFANATETLAHLSAQYAKYGTTALTVWLTAEGKFIDLLVLEALVAEGKLTCTGGTGLSPYATPTYGLVVVAAEKVA